MPWFNKHFSADILLLAAAHRKGDRRRHHGALQLPPKSRGAALSSTLWQQNLRELCQGKVGLDISKRYTPERRRHGTGSGFKQQLDNTFRNRFWILGSPV